MLHTRLHLNVVIMRKTGGRLWILKRKGTRFWISELLDGKYCDAVSKQSIGANLFYGPTLWNNILYDKLPNPFLWLRAVSTTWCESRQYESQYITNLEYVNLCKIMYTSLLYLLVFLYIMHNEDLLLLIWTIYKKAIPDVGYGFFICSASLQNELVGWYKSS